MLSGKNSLMLLRAKQAERKPKLFLQFPIFFLVFLVGTLATSFAFAAVVIAMMFSNPAFLSGILSGGTTDSAILTLMEDAPELMLAELFLTGLTTLAAILYCNKIEKRSLSSMGFVKENLLPRYLKGFGIGAGMLILCAGIGMLFGAFEVELSAHIPISTILLFLVGFLIQGMSEEVLVRGYFMISLSNRCKVPIAVGVSSVVFSLLHLANPGFTLLPFINITLFGVFMGVYILRTEEIWGACAIHSAWNFVQGNIVGMRVSGTAPLPTVVTMEPSGVSDLITGGSFGIEGSLIVTVVLLAAIVLTLRLPKKATNTMPRPAHPTAL